jgi:hypothetical protein
MMRECVITIIVKLKRLAQAKFLQVDFRYEASHEFGISVTQTDGAGLVPVRKQTLETVSARSPNGHVHLVRLPPEQPTIRPKPQVQGYISLFLA